MTRPSLSRPAGSSMLAVRRDMTDIPEHVWDGLLAQTPGATPFSRYCLQREWWEAYGANAHEETLVVVAPDGAPAAAPLGIVPLMHRHELEPGDVEARTTLRHQPGRALRPVPDSATAVFFGASYHADYATILAAPANLPAVCEATAEYLAASSPEPWDVVDLRHLRRADPATAALQAAFERRAAAACLAVSREEEEVCPVLTLPPGRDFEGYLDTLDKKERHEIRRKIRRAEAAGAVKLERSDGSPSDLEAFVDLHQKRWGANGLFPPTEGGAASRHFFAGLFGSCAEAGIVELHFLTVGGRRIAAGVTMIDADNVYYYNAGVDPEARELSPGVVMVARYIQQAIERGKTRLDFMRGNEPYKYTWGAVDEPIDRLLVRRTDAGLGEAS